MSEGTAAEPPQGTPSRRALGAMESAVRRAREPNGADVPTRPPRASGPATVRPRPAPHPPDSAVTRGPRSVHGRRRRGAEPDALARSPSVAWSLRWLVAVAVVAAGRRRSSGGSRKWRRLAPSTAARRCRRPMQAPSHRATPATARRHPGAGAGGATTSSTTTSRHAGARRGRRSAGDHLPHPSVGSGGPGHPGRRLQLPQLRRPDRGDLQRSGGADELPGPEHVHGHRAADDRLGVRRRSRSRPPAGPRTR